jgi:hypothetical protein
MTQQQERAGKWLFGHLLFPDTHLEMTPAEVYARLTVYERNVTDRMIADVCPS